MRRRSISSETLSRLGDDEPIPFVTEATLTEPAPPKPPLSRPEAFHRIGLTLKRMGSDRERARVLAALSELYGDAT
jgi:hypothetical protein